MIKKLALLFLFVSFPVFATWSNPIATWVNPTTYTDGSPVQPTDIGGYRFYCNIGESNEVIVDADIGFATQYRFPYGTFQVGEHFCQMTVYDTAGVESQPLAAAPFVVDPRVLNPVIQFSVGQ